MKNTKRLINKKRMLAAKNRRGHQAVGPMQVYTPDELAVLVRHANQMEQLLILTGVNCAFGSAKLGTLRTSNVLFDRTQWNGRTGLNGSYVRHVSYPAGSYGEWLLWEETADLLRWGVRRAVTLGSQFVACRDSGARLWHEHTHRPFSHFQNRWSGLNRRVRRECPEFPSLPMGSLMHVLPGLIRHRYDDALALTAYTYRTPCVEAEIPELGNKPFGRLHKAIRELRDHFKPMLDAARSGPRS